MKPGQIVFDGKTSKGLPILIRYPQESDLEDLLEYINILSHEKTFINFQGEKISFLEEKKFLKEVLSKMKKSKQVFLLAYSGNKLIGDSDLELKEKVEKHVGSFGIAVLKDFRTKGVGTLLMEKVIEEAVKNLTGLKIIELWTFGNNSIAKKVYEKFGFKEYGRLPLGVKHKNIFVDRVHMYKEIQ